MIKLKDAIEQVIKPVYHVTNKKYLNKVLKHGIGPRIPADMPGEERGVFMFKSYDDMENALMNWLGDRYDEDDELVVLKINPDGLTLKNTAEYEVMSKTKIPPQNIIGYEDL